MDAEWELIVPFLTDNPVYARGVEFGMLFEEMKRRPRIIQNYFLRANQEQILLLASRMRYAVVSMKPWDGDWFYLYMEREGGDEQLRKDDGGDLRSGPEAAA
jgi:hypothetical protein